MTLLEKNKSAVFEATSLSLSFLYHESATTCQIDSNKVSNFKLRLDLCNCVKSEIYSFFFFFFYIPLKIYKTNYLLQYLLITLRNTTRTIIPRGAVDYDNPVAVNIE